MSKVKDRTPGKIVGHQDRQLFSGAAATLGQLTDVEAPSPSNGQVLAYESATQRWKPAAPATSTAAGSAYSFDYQSNVTHIDILKPSGTTQVVEAWIDLWLQTENNNPLPSFEFLGFNPFQLENGLWRAETYANSQFATDSANTNWINSHNVTGNSVVMGFVGGGTGHTYAASAMHRIYIRLRSIHQGKLFVSCETQATRKADAFPVHFYFHGVIGQPLANLQGVRMTVDRNAMTVNAQVMAQ